MIGSNLNTNFQDHLQFTSNTTTITSILIITVVVVVCVAMILVIVLVIFLRRCTHKKSSSFSLNEFVAELEHRNTSEKITKPSKSNNPSSAIRKLSKLDYYWTLLQIL